MPRRSSASTRPADASPSPPTRARSPNSGVTKRTLPGGGVWSLTRPGSGTTNFMKRHPVAAMAAPVRRAPPPGAWRWGHARPERQDTSMGNFAGHDACVASVRCRVVAGGASRRHAISGTRGRSVGSAAMHQRAGNRHVSGVVPADAAGWRHGSDCRTAGPSCGARRPTPGGRDSGRASGFRAVCGHWAIANHHV